MLESQIEARFKKRVESLPGVLCLKLTCPGFSGVPDRLILLPGGGVIFAELKQPGRRERKRQEFVQGILRGLGFEVFSSVSSAGDIEAVRASCEEVLSREGVHPA